MKISSNYNANGDIVNLKVSKKNHIDDKSLEKLNGDSIALTFKDMFNKAIGQVNDMELKATDLANKLAIDPDSVDIHDVQIAAEEAEMGVLLTKGIVDRVIRAYKEIINVR